MAFQSVVHGVVAALTLAMVMVLNLVDRVHGGGFSGGGWNQAHATYYGGADASGTQGMCRSICSLSSFHFIYLVQLECRSEPAPSTSRHMKKSSSLLCLNELTYCMLDHLRGLMICIPAPWVILY